MRILLCVPIFQAGSTSSFVLKALSELGHHIAVWDYRTSNEPPKTDYDLAISWNGFFNPNLIKSPKILFFLDDINFGNHKSLLNKVGKQYDKVYAINKFDSENLEITYLPMGSDSDIHKKIDFQNEDKEGYKTDVSFIGTLRDQERLDFIKEIYSLLNKNNIPFRLFGNGWSPFILPAYYNELNKVCNASKIVVNQHFSNIGPSTKDMEIPACGGALMICDDAKPVKELYPMIPTYKNAEECFELIKYYLKNEDERLKLVKEMQEIAQKYSYKEQLKESLKNLP